MKRIRHRDMNCLALFFPKNQEIINHVKKIPGIKYSATHTCWYLQETKDAWGMIYDGLKGKVWLDYTAVKKTQIEKNKVERTQPDKEPVHEEMPLSPKLIEPIANQQSYSEIHNSILEQIRKKLKFKNYSPSTIKTYTEQFKLFMQFFPNSHPEVLGEEEIQHYMMHLIENKKLSVSTQNQAINAIKFYYEKILKQDRKVYDLERPMKEKKLPEVLSQEEVMAIFDAAANLKHRCMLAILYASGLRRSELLNLRIGDIDFHRNAVLVRGGKGRKDRHTVMAQSLMPLVEQYLAEYKPKFWLFEGATGKQYSAASLQQVLKKASYKAGIRKNVRLHMLRHSFATHLLESGTSTRYIQVLLGHDSPKTTEIYAQVTRFGLDKVMSPLDHLAATKQLRSNDQ
ncbi:MAG: tyrosine-type recombinase/integrase [Cyclobacteriaceae bacterium]|nr:tyrosine-type recombinase/integrase [Cyclobacteriaceae bacterium]UYN87622.1 MAG: tyrosine-type recombinase/integrase [Cyclobacteriaceae bacterium]